MSNNKYLPFYLLIINAIVALLLVASADVPEQAMNIATRVIVVITAGFMLNLLKTQRSA